MSKHEFLAGVLVTIFILIIINIIAVVYVTSPSTEKMETQTNGSEKTEITVYKEVSPEIKQTILWYAFITTTLVIILSLLVAGIYTIGE
ncbi:MAG: hypothetical protein GXO68_05690 [Crenarchaeota archaeon]|nr:hypothetical protein [Thermoproteota archaeon]